ncbi:DUF397 domain-containing protein [Streptomyces olivaceus]|uniref:DUF397 domain-containing protein n=1 Tax=Streptomyces olivaceus TaxID=47716 RepID=UPI001CCE5A65|nr:DUF397 domain-containing protein [Streptomyces olivaceus]MBZ6230105.1 DUF397 domain-containing protein [Streptomyces olivaceus]
MAADPELRWFKSSYSGGSGTECVECAYVSHGALIRDSKCNGGPILNVRPQAWLRFVASVCQGVREPA